jgi:short-subunit dehydrogenase
VKGFTEALITDLRIHAPHVKVSLVMPGHIGTSIFFNTAAVLGRPSPKEMTAEDLRPLRERFGAAANALSDDQLRAILQQLGEQFRDAAPTSAAEAATIILDGVRGDVWRILVGADAIALDQMVRAAPEQAYETSFVQQLRQQGFFAMVPRG